VRRNISALSCSFSTRTASIANLVGAKVRRVAQITSIVPAHIHRISDTLFFLLTSHGTLLSEILKHLALSSRGFFTFFSLAAGDAIDHCVALYTLNNSTVRSGRENKSENSDTVCLQTIRWWEKFLMRLVARESGCAAQRKPRAEGEKRGGINFCGRQRRQKLFFC